MYGLIQTESLHVLGLLCIQRKYEKFLNRLQQQGQREQSANQVESERVQSKAHHPPQRSGHHL